MINGLILPVDISLVIIFVTSGLALSAILGRVLDCRPSGCHFFLEFWGLGVTLVKLDSINPGLVFVHVELGGLTALLLVSERADSCLDLGDLFNLFERSSLGTLCSLISIVSSHQALVLGIKELGASWWGLGSTALFPVLTATGFAPLQVIFGINKLFHSIDIHILVLFEL